MKYKVVLTYQMIDFGGCPERETLTSLLTASVNTFVSRQGDQILAPARVIDA